MAAEDFPIRLLDVAQFSTSAAARRHHEFLRLRRGCRLMAGVSIYGYLDETGDVRKDDRLFMCGYAGWGTSQEDGPLDEFDKRWRSAKGTVGPIHATELLSQSGDFYGWDTDSADELVARLVDAIRTTIPIGLAVGFDNKHYRALTQGQQKEIGRPLLICMSRVIDLAVNFIGEMRARGDQIDGINLTFDDSEKDAVEMLSTWIQLKRARKELVDYIASVGFADDKRFFPLQAADLLANLTNRYWQAELIKKSPSSDRTERHLRNLLTPEPFLPFAYRVGFVTAAEMDEAVRLHKRLY
jgi:hypothetical protein